MEQDIPSLEIFMLLNTVVSLPEVSIEIQEDFLSKIQEQIAMHFLCFAMSHVELGRQQGSSCFNNKPMLPLYMSTARNGVQGFVQYKEYSVHVMMRLQRKQSFDDCSV